MSAAPIAPAPSTAVRKTPRWLLPLLPLVSGVLFAYSLPPYHFSWLGWIALMPLLWTCARLPRTLWAAGAGLATGLVAGVVQIGWDGLGGASGFSRNYALAPFIWMAFVFALTGAWAQWSRQISGRSSIGWVLGVAAMGTVAEWLTGFTPLPVGVALGQAQNLPLIQMAAFTGIWGVSFLMYLVNAALADVVTPTDPARWKVERHWHLTFAVVATVLVAAVAGLFIVAAEQARESNYRSERQTQDGARMERLYPHLEVAAVQDYGGPETATGDPAQGRVAASADPTTASPRDATDLMRLAAKEGAQLIVGTEHSFGASFRPGSPNDPLRIIARSGKTHLVVGHEMADATTPGANPFNCATLVGPTGAIGTHHKIHLFLGERQTMQAGEKATVASSPWGKTGLLICFDTCYTGPTRQAVQEGATVIAVPNYDPPTPNSVLHHLHAALMPFRAVENGVAYVRADPNGLSQIVQPYGEVIAHAPMYKNDVVSANVRLGDGRGTFFTRWGDWLPVVCLLSLTLQSASGAIKKRRLGQRSIGETHLANESR